MRQTRSNESFILQRTSHRQSDFEGERKERIESILYMDVESHFGRLLVPCFAASTGDRLAAVPIGSIGLSNPLQLPATITLDNP